MEEELKEMRAQQTVMLSSVAELGKSMATFVNHSGKSGTTNKLKPTEAKLYKLAGWCQVASISQIPVVWAHMFKAAGYTDQAAALNRVVKDKMKKTNEIVSRSIWECPILRSYIRKEGRQTSEDLS